MCDVTSRDDAALREILARWAPERDADRVMRLLGQPEELKAEIVYILTRFWDRHLKPEYERCRLLEERSIRYYAEHPPVGSARTLFTEVTGREYPSVHLPPVERTTHLVFLPTCHGGPYVSAVDVHGDGRTLVVTYNCRPTAGGDRRVGIPIGEVFPPLKGLADETRLEILSILTEGEFYAQQIVDRLEISQSAVSRHLRLMVACGILRERRQGRDEVLLCQRECHLGSHRASRCLAFESRCLSLGRGTSIDEHTEEATLSGFRVLAISGSPRRDGNTERLIDSVLDGRILRRCGDGETATGGPSDRVLPRLPGVLPRRTGRAVRYMTTT